MFVTLSSVLLLATSFLPGQCEGEGGGGGADENPVPPPFPTDVTPSLIGTPTDTTPAPGTGANTPSPQPAPPATAKPIVGLPSHAPVTGRRRRAATFASWEIWWELHRDRYLARTEEWQPPITDEGSFLGRGHLLAKRQAVPVAEIRATLAKLLRSEDVTVRESAVLPYGRTVESAEHLEALIPLLADEHHHVRERAALALGLRRLPEARPILQSLALDEPSGRAIARRPNGVEPRMRSYAVLGLGLEGHRDSVPSLLRVIQREEDRAELVGAAIAALGLMGPEARAAVPLLVQRLAVDDLPVGAQAIIPEALGKIGDPSGRPTLELLIRDRKPHRLVRAAALVGYGRMLSGTADESAVKLLRQVLRHEGDPGLRHAAAMALGSLGGSAAREELIRALRAQTHPDDRAWLCLSLGVWQHGRPADVGAHQALREAFLSERNGTIRSALVLAMGLSTDRDAAPTIEQAVADSRDRRFQSFGGMALGLLGSARSSRTLQGLLAESSERHPRVEAATALWLIGDAEAPALACRSLSRARHALDQSTWAEALGGLRSPHGAEALMALAGSSTAQSIARARAAVALGQIVEARSGSVLARVTQDTSSEGSFDFVREVASLK